MKKFLTVLLLGTVSFTAILSNVSAQVFTSTLTPTSTSFMAEAKSADVKKSDFTTKEAYNSAKATAKAYKANVKATKNFNKEFKGADAKWHIEDNVTTASFYRNGIKTMVVYDKKGRWLHTMDIYQKDKLPTNIAGLIRHNYRSYNITQVQDIKEGVIQFYVIHLENEKGYKQICVYDGQLGVISEFDKSL